jgi:hypothetical protein
MPRADFGRNGLLRHALAWGESVEEAARLLGRSGTTSEVRLKAQDLGLRSQQDKATDPEPDR